MTLNAATITPFTIDIPQEALDDLAARLRRARFAETIPGVGWDLGTDREALEALVAHWREGYDWRRGRRGSTPCPNS